MATTKKKPGKSSFPGFIKPMLCTKVAEVPDDPRYLYEVKWDGYRIISYVHGGKVSMKTRSAQEYEAKYPPIVKALLALEVDVVLDGEVVVFDDAGRPNFNAVQRYNGHTSSINYCVFDLLWLDGKSYMDEPLELRKQALARLLKGNKVLLYSDSFDDGPALYKEMGQRDLEGVVAKERDSAYVPDQRANAWLKIPIRKRQEFVIGGWTESDKVRAFRNLIFGAYVDGQFTWIGRSGGGFKEKDMADILSQLQKLETKESPFINKVLDTKGAAVHWVKPKLVANFEYAELIIYDDGKPPRIRKPATFLGFRSDKKPKDVVLEIAKPTPAKTEHKTKVERVKKLR